MLFPDPEPPLAPGHAHLRHEGVERTVRDPGKGDLGARCQVEHQVGDPSRVPAHEPPQRQRHHLPEIIMANRIADRQPDVSLEGSEGVQEGGNAPVPGQLQDVGEVDPPVPPPGLLRGELPGIGPALHGGGVHAEELGHLRGREEELGIVGVHGSRSRFGEGTGERVVPG